MSKRTYLTSPEPEWFHLENLSDEEKIIKLDKAMSWYWSHYRFNARKNKQWVLDYLKKSKTDKETVDFIKQNVINKFKGLGTLFRLSVLNAPLEDGHKERMKNILATLVADGKEKLANIPVKPKISIQQRIKDQVNEYLYELELKIDDVGESILKSQKNTFSVEDWLNNNKIKAQQAQMIGSYFQSHVEEVELAYNKEDEQLVEGYDYFTRPQLKKYLAFIKDLHTTPIEYSTVIKTIKRPRKTKRKTPGQITKNVKFCAKSKEYDISSIEPREIVGATKLVVFNEKTRMMTIYYASSMAGELSAKGSTLIGFDKEKSTQRRLRKPKDVLNVTKSGGIRAISAKYKELTTKESIPTGRINKHTILLKAFK